MNVKQFIRVSVTVTAVLLTASYAVAQGNGGGHGNGGGGGGGGNGPSYQIVELDSQGGLFEGFPREINNTGLVVGGARDPISGDGGAACWTVDKTGEDVTSTLHFLAGGGGAYGVNDFGKIVGANNDAAAYWENPDAEQLFLPTPQESTRSIAEAINSDGVICGWMTVPDSGGQLSNVAVIWQTTVSAPIELPKLQPTDSTYAGAINDLNDQGIALVVGQEESAAVAWTVRLIDGTLVVDSPVVLDVPGQDAWGVNNSGEICGDVWPDAVVWDGNSSQILDRSATIKGFGGKKTCTFANAYAINAGGVIVGHGHFQGAEIAVVWPSASGSMLVLDKFIKGLPITNLSYAFGVNDSGEIVGPGWDSNRSFHLGYVAIPK